PEACGLRHLSFAVEDLDQAVADLRSKGVELEPIRVDELTGKRFTFFQDPDRLPLEVYEI
ncbi:VOC family protein, partial [Leptolyngbya sp. FACHB-711]